MRKLTLFFFCFCVAGCQPGGDSGPMDFKERQEQLFHEIDHRLVYQSCQQLMRRFREGKLSATTFYCDDTAPGQSELPEPVRALRPTYVRVDETMVEIVFHHGQDGIQSLSCFSDEFGGPPPGSWPT